MNETNGKPGWIVILGDEQGEMGRVWCETLSEARELSMFHQVAAPGQYWAKIHYCD